MSTATPTGRLAAWFGSSYSNGAGGECVECGFGDDGIRIRDSKDVEGAVITVGQEAWAAFVKTLHLG
ncbi:DUF397 domain-containing protein [Streptomyces griseoflavus]|uniref:DUF397 domain-containing protein n=1 Tax=Streptomyces griseoflavus TaxID=35619 RepID=UPI0033BB96C4